MLFKLKNNLISYALLLMLFQMMVRAAIIKPLKSSDNKPQKGESVQQTAANNEDEVVIPILSSSAEDNPDVPHFPGFPNFPHVHLSQYNDDTDRSAPTERALRRGDEFKGDRRLPNEEPGYYHENTDGPEMPERPDSPESQNRGYNRNPSPKPKMYKAIERVYYYPQDDGDSEPDKNRQELAAMKEYHPENYGPYENQEEEVDDAPETQEDYRNRNIRNTPENQRQLLRNSPISQNQDNDDNSDGQESDGTQVSIANDVKEFGKEAVDEADRFEKFLDNLRNFAVDSEREYSSPKENQNDKHETQDSDDQSDDRDNYRNTNFRESMAGHPSEDRTRDYEQTGQYGSPDDYNNEKRSYQNQKDKINKGGHKYHKDRRRHRKPLSDQGFEQRRHEVTSLIDAEPDEADYLSNSDVVNQLKKSETKYNTGVDPVYSSQKDFDEVKRLEKIIENVALLNKEKEKNAAEAHDQHEISESSVKNVQTKEGIKTKVSKKSENN